jgi:hypothetical protein
VSTMPRLCAAILKTTIIVDNSRGMPNTLCRKAMSTACTCRCSPQWAHVPGLCTQPACAALKRGTVPAVRTGSPAYL